MTGINMERGDTFIVTEERCRGNHYTCIGIGNGIFYAGDTRARVWKFERIPNNKYRVFKSHGPTWGSWRTIDAETVVKE